MKRSREKLHLLFVSETYPSGFSGASLKTRSTIEFLLARGHRIDVACVDFQSLAKRSLSHPGLKILSVYKQSTRTSRVRFMRKLLLLAFSFKPVIVSRLFDAKLQTLIETLVQSQDYNYIFFDNFASLQYLKNKNEKNIYIDHADITGLMWKRYFLETNLFLKFFYFTEYIRCQWYEKHYISRVSQIWAISSQTKKHLERVSSSSVLVMPTIVPPVQRVFNPKARNIVFTGTLSWPENKNGLMWFLKHCWGEVLQTYPNIKLFVVGQQADTSFKSLLREYPNIEFKGFVKSLSDIYKTAGLAISPLLVNEGLKIKILTYLNYGLPVVATQESVTGLKIKGGIKVSSNHEFSKTVIKLLSQDKLRQRLSREGITNIEAHYRSNQLREFFINTAHILI